MNHDELEILQNLPLELKERKSLQRIREFTERYYTYVSFSGGMDSNVLRHLVRRIDDSIPLVFCKTGMQHPGLYYFIKTFINNPDEYKKTKRYGFKTTYYTEDKIVILHPKKTPKQVIEDYGYPVGNKHVAQLVERFQKSKDVSLLQGDYGIPKKWHCLIDAPFQVSARCCDVMKKAPFQRFEKENKRAPFIGTRAEESRDRKDEYLQIGGCNKFVEPDSDKRPKSMPLSFWTKQDILKYTLKHNLRYPDDVYGAIEHSKALGFKTTKRDRTGCIFCAFGLKEYKNRFQLLYKENKKLWEFMMYDLGFKEVFDYLDVQVK